MAKKKTNEEIMKERREKIALCCEEFESQREMKEKGQLSCETINNVYQEDGFNHTPAQRGYVKALEMISSLLNDIIHKVLLLLNPIKFFMFVPEGLDFITVTTYITNIRYYQELGYKLLIADGSQRIRTIVGFMRDEVTLPKLKGFGKKGEPISVVDVHYSELTEAAKNRIKAQQIPFVCVCSHNEDDYNEIFDKNNRLQTNLNDVELMNNLYGKTKIWQKALEALKDIRIIDLLSLSGDKSYDMQDKNEEMMKSDRGTAVMSIFKILVHINGNYATGTVKQMVLDMLDDVNGVYQNDDNVKELFDKFYKVVDICAELPDTIYRGKGKNISMNRIRSVLAAVAQMEKNHSGVILDNMDEIADAIDKIYMHIPSSQDASASQSNVNKEIKMYTAIFQYICSLNDRSSLQNATLDSCLRFNLKDGLPVDVKTPIDDYLYERNKVPA